MRHIAVAYHQTLIVPGSNQAPPAISHIKSPRAGLINFNYAADVVIDSTAAEKNCCRAPQRFCFFLGPSYPQLDSISLSLRQ